MADLLRSLPRPDDEYLDILEDITRNQPPVEKSSLGTLIDTSVMIDLERGTLSEAHFLERFSGEKLSISAITASELLHGLYRAARERRREARSDFAERMFARFPVIPLDLKAARIHASLLANARPARDECRRARPDGRGDRDSPTAMR